METTIQISSELLERLKMMKIMDNESYENIIWDLIEDRLEFSGETKKDIIQSEREIRAGKIVSIEQIKKKLAM